MPSCLSPIASSGYIDREIVANQTTTPTAPPAPGPNIHPPSERRLDRDAALLLFGLTVFRLWYAGTHELLQDESYYWQWSRHLDWGYYDNTPLAAVLIHFFTSLLGPTELGVRAGAVFCALTASIFIYLLGKRLFGTRTAFLSLLLANVVIPLFAAGSIMMTMDPPQLALWAAAMYVIHIALGSVDWSTGRRTSIWLLAGLICGLAAQAKIYALLLLPCLLVYLIASPTDRHWLRRPEPYLGAVAALAIFAPFVWWTHTHGNAFWMHVGVMGSRGDEQDKPFKFFFRFLGDPAGMLSPCLYLIFLYGLFDGYRRGVRERNANLLYVWAFTVTVFVAFGLVSIKTKTEANWAAAAYVGGVYLIALVLIRLWDSVSLGKRIWAGIAVGTSALMGVLVYFPGPLYAGFGLGKASTKEKSVHAAMKIDRTTELYGWQTMADRIQMERQAMGTDAFVFGINYRMPSEAAFYLPDRPQTYSLFLGDRANEYMFWEDPKALVGRDAIFINDSENLDHIDDLRAVFDRVDVRPPLLVRHPPYGQFPIRTIQIIRCYHFRGYDVADWQKGW
jgi:hypothetical protein